VKERIATPFTYVNEGLAGATIFAGAAVFLQEPQKKFHLPEPWRRSIGMSL